VQSFSLAPNQALPVEITEKNSMHHRSLSLAVLLSCLLMFAACQNEQSGPAGSSPGQPSADAGKPAPVGANTPLPKDAFKASISVPQPPPVIKAGEKTTIEVKVKNDSASPWPALGQPDHKYQVNLGNHWYDAQEKLLTNDDARGFLPHDLKPGEEITIPLKVTAPAAPGDYTLELDMVQEMIGWFKQKGGQPFRLKVKVE
jgi:hypothetical protein